jgi:lipid A ethanolaminephosphotransferase
VNTFRYFGAERRRNVKETLLEDPSAISKSRDVCVLIIGESARRDHFSLYGYGRETNPYTAQDSVTVLLANSSATYTVAGVKCILQPQDTKGLLEILPNYLYRHGADVTWRTSNWGEPPVHVEKYWKKADLKQMHPDADERFDGILLAGLKEDILSSTADKVFVVLHTNTSHGPAYNTCYPPEFEQFTPVCETVEMSKASQEEVFNAYDNSILYTD